MCRSSPQVWRNPGHQGSPVGNAVNRNSYSLLILPGCLGSDVPFIAAVWRNPGHQGSPVGNAVNRNSYSLLILPGCRGPDVPFITAVWRNPGHLGSPIGNAIIRNPYSLLIYYQGAVARMCRSSPQFGVTQWSPRCRGPDVFPVHQFDVTLVT
jgi:hypothetical protein